MKIRNSFTSLCSWYQSLFQALYILNDLYCHPCVQQLNHHSFKSKFLTSLTCLCIIHFAPLRISTLHRAIILLCLFMLCHVVIFTALSFLSYYSSHRVSFLHFFVIPYYRVAPFSHDILIVYHLPIMSLHHVSLSYQRTSSSCFLPSFCARVLTNCYH